MKGTSWNTAGMKQLGIIMSLP